MARFSSSSINQDAVEDRIDDLRRKVEMLMSEQVTPAVSRAAGRAQDLAEQVSSSTRHQADNFAGVVKERPFLTVVLAAALGYLACRILGR
jgi:ElaB/YqjD/DUF883 family membrane-anchored ribosome-binding protein